MNYLALFIPILFFIGLFSVIALNIVAKYRSKAMMINRMESADEWYKSEAQANIAKAEARAIRKHGSGLRLCGLFIGIGIGMGIGCAILAWGYIPNLGRFDATAIAIFLVISLAMIFGGGGVIGAYFLQRILDGKSSSKR
jgi:hypothetical protein